MHKGAGAYICGEETGLMESLEGKRGHPRPKPPFPAGFGLWGQPTTVNNVETLFNAPFILDRGHAWFKEMGSDKSPRQRAGGHLRSRRAARRLRAPPGHPRTGGA